MYTTTKKNEILTHLRVHGLIPTYKKFRISQNTLRYWYNQDYREEVKEKVRKTYNPEKRDSVRSYDTNRKAYERQRIDSQIARRIKKAPYIFHSDEEILKELKTLKEKKGCLFSKVFYNKGILTYQQHFYEKERELFTDKQVARKLIKNRMKYLEKEPREIGDKEILRGFKISGVHYGFSHFSPLWFKWFIEQTSCKSVLDPCGGWGHRLLGTLGTELKTYIYNDWDKRSVIGAQNLFSKYSEEFQCEVQFFNEKAENLETSNLSYDTIFTCPPYMNKEVYQGKSFQNKEDYANWWKSVCQNIVKDSVETIGIVIDNKNKDVVSKPLFELGFKCHEEHSLAVNKSHFERNSKEQLLIFKNK